MAYELKITLMRDGNAASERLVPLAKLDGEYAYVEASGPIEEMVEEEAWANYDKSMAGDS